MWRPLRDLLRPAGPDAELAGVDPDLEIRRMETLDESVAAALRRERMLTALLSLFATVTLLLTAVGLYGTTAYAVARRTAEIRRAHRLHRLRTIDPPPLHL